MEIWLWLVVDMVVDILWKMTGIVFHREEELELLVGGYMELGIL